MSNASGYTCWEGGAEVDGAYPRSSGRGFAPVLHVRDNLARILPTLTSRKRGVFVSRVMRYNSKMGVAVAGTFRYFSKAGVGESRIRRSGRSPVLSLSPLPFITRKRRVSYDFFVVGTIDNPETVEKRRKCGGCGPIDAGHPLHRPQVTTETWGGCPPSSSLTRSG